MKRTFFAFLTALLLFTGTAFAQTKSGFTNNSGGILHAGQVVINDFSIASGMTTTTGATVGVEVLGIVYGLSANDGETGLVSENWFIWIKDGGILCTNAVARGDGLALSTGTAGSATSQGSYSGNKDEYTFAVATSADATPPYRVSAFILRHGGIATASVGDADTVDGFHAAGTATASFLLALDAEKDLHLGTGDLSATLGTFEGNVTLNNQSDLLLEGLDNTIQGSGILRIDSGDVIGAGSVVIQGSGGVTINSGNFGSLGTLTYDALVTQSFEISNSLKMVLNSEGLGIGVALADVLDIDAPLHIRTENIGVAADAFNFRHKLIIETGNADAVIGFLADNDQVQGIWFQDHDGAGNIAITGRVRYLHSTDDLQLFAGGLMVHNFKKPAGLDWESVVNDDSRSDVNFRVETNSFTNAIFVDAGANSVSIGTPLLTGNITSTGTIKIDEGEFFYPDSGNLQTRIYATAGVDLQIEADDDLILAPDNDFNALAVAHRFKDAAGSNTWFQIDVNGDATFFQDLTAQGDTAGFRQIIAFGTTESFTVTDGFIDADQWLGPGGVRDTITRISAGVPVPYSGDILGIAVTFDVTAVDLDSGETLSFSVAKNGSNVGPTAVWDAVAGVANGYVVYAVQAKGVDTFSAGDTLSCYISASGNVDPEGATINDVQVIIFVATD